MLQPSFTLRASCSGDPFIYGALALLASAHSQMGLSVKAVNALVIDARELRAQQVMDVPVTKAPAHMRDLHDLLVQYQRDRVNHRVMTAAVSGQ